MLGLPPSELHSLTVAEFLAAYQGWLHAREQQMRSDLERSRWAAFGLARCWLSESMPLSRFLPLPWDGDYPSADEDGEEMSMEARRARVAEILNTISHER